MHSPYAFNRGQQFQSTLNLLSLILQSSFGASLFTSWAFQWKGLACSDLIKAIEFEKLIMHSFISNFLAVLELLYGFYLVLENSFPSSSAPLWMIIVLFLTDVLSELTASSWHLLHSIISTVYCSPPSIHPFNPQLLSSASLNSSFPYSNFWSAYSNLQLQLIILLSISHTKFSIQIIFLVPFSVIIDSFIRMWWFWEIMRHLAIRVVVFFLYRPIWLAVIVWFGD